MMRVRVPRVLLTRVLLTRVLALLLFLQWGTVFSHCLELTGAGQPGCYTAMGGMLVQHHGTAPAHNPRDSKTHDWCPVCQGLATAAVPPSVGVPEPFVFAFLQHADARTQPWLPAVAAFAHRARAPPIG